jgi:hypothetical protein
MTTFFEPFSEIFKTQAEDTLSERMGWVERFASFTRNWDVAQPHFRGSGDHKEWGFYYAGDFDIRVLGTRTHLTVSPAYAFSPSEDGFVDVRALAQAVTLIPDVSDARPAINETLRDVVPQVMENLIRNRLEMPVSNLLALLPGADSDDVDVSCDSSDELPEQQQTCFDNVEEGLGQVPDGIEPRNFACVSRRCTFHPIVQEVNALPDSLELVLAPDLDGESGALTALYQAAGVCGPRPEIGRSEGTIATMHHGNGAYGLACAPLF